MTLRTLLVLVLVGLWAGPALAEDGVVDVTSRIRKVTVYSDRASVTREANVSLEDAPKVFALRKLPGWVDDASVRVALVPADAGQIVDVQVSREYLAKATDEAYRKAEEAVQEISDQIAALDDELRVLAAQDQQIQAIKVFSLDKMPKEAAMREVKVESYGAVVKFVSDALRETAKLKRDVLQKRRELEPELAARQRRLEELQGLTQLEETTLLVTLAGGSGATL